MPENNNERYGNLFEEYSKPSQRPAPKNLFEEEAPAPRRAPQNLFEDAPQKPQPRNLFDQDTPLPRQGLFDEPAPHPVQQRQPRQSPAPQQRPQQAAAPQHPPQQAPAASTTPGQQPRQSPAPSPAPGQQPQQPAVPQPGHSSMAQPAPAASRPQPAPQRQPAPPLRQPVQKVPPQKAQPQNLFQSAAPAAPAAPQRYSDDATRVSPIQNAAAAAQPPIDATRVSQPQPSRGGGANAAGGQGGQPPRKGGGKGGKGGSGGGKKKKPKAGKYVFFNVVKAFFCLFCAGVILVGIMAVAAANYVVDATRDDDILLDLNNMSLSQTGYMYAWDPASGSWIEYSKITGNANSIWTPLSEISDYVINALISTEDKNFYDHSGFSLTRTIGAGLNEVFHFRPTFGGSTIDQQLVKNLTGDNQTFDDPGDADSGMTAGYLRKLREIFRAIGLNNNYSKDMILEAYLNTMPLSGTIVGVGAGAREYFNKNPLELELHEAAMIVGITNWPTKYNPYTNPENCLERRNDILYFMHQDGVITDSQYQTALAQPLSLYTGERDAADNASSTVSSYFEDAVYWQVISDLVSKGVVSNATEAQTFYFNSGLQIYTTVDLEIQAIVEDVYLHAYEEGSPLVESLYANEKDENGNTTGEIVRPESSMVVMDYAGRVLAVVGGTGEKEASLTLNRATQSPRQVGSTMKMVAAYPLGIEYDLINWSRLFTDVPTLTANGQTPTTAEGAVWPKNWGATYSGNSVSIDYAVTRSLNTVAVQVGVAVGVQEMFTFATETLGITTLDSTNDFNYSPMVLGANYEGITNLQLTSAYAMYGNGGDVYTPRFYERVLDSEGNLVMTADNYPVKAISDETSYIANRMLQNVMTVSGGTANGMGISGVTTAAKTGTTDEDRDRWIVGLTPEYVAGVWVGYDSTYTLSVGTGQNNPPSRVWREVMTRVYETRESGSFPEMPAGVETRQYCTESGMMATPNCPSTATGYYKRDDQTADCYLHGHE